MARGSGSPSSESDAAAVSGRPSKLWLLIALLGIAGLAVTTYLTSNALSHTEVGCSLSGCNTVLGSKWSKIFGIPVSAFGMATYAIIMLGALHAYQSPIYDLRGRRVVALTAVIGVLASIYLTTIELLVIKAACQYCITSAVLVVVAAVAVVVAARKEGPLWAAIRRR
ncbi:MAG: vitamin K epoxide reductase family protein [Chloroflexi bacterium]|jgi:uncharacterized membrane protein|nr:vitamin K epoxide reductase family protein [Chloroflexota bacterium]MDA1283124.1 vitamin K epoxide reductase family protein [Chloroflexota bacterium]